MKLTISGAIENNPALAHQVDRANQILSEVVGATADSVTAEWGLEPDPNNSKHRRLLLVLTDFTGTSVRAWFAPEDLANAERLDARFSHIWGNLLQDRSHRQLKTLTGSDTPG